MAAFSAAPPSRTAPVLVLGAGGTVGGRLADRLVASGIRVRALARRDEVRESWRARGFEVRLGDLAHPNSLAEAAVGCEVVYHCAGSADHGGDAQALSWLHVAGTENVLQAAAHARVRRVVLFSCADVTLHDGDRIHIKEDQPMLGRPLGAWSRSKLLAEEVALRGGPSGLEVTALRPAYLWGAGDFTNLPTLCREGLAGGIRLYGAGAQLFSVAHLDNVVHGLRLAAEQPAAAGQAFHLCDGEYETAYEFFGALSSACGLPAPRRGFGPWQRTWAMLAGARGAYVEAVRRSRGCLLDMQRAINDLGYSPVVRRGVALAELSRFVASQGGVAGLAEHSRATLTRADADVFDKVATQAQPAVATT